MTATSPTVGMLEQQLLELARIDVLAAADDHVLEPALDRAIAARVHRAEVAGMQPAVGVDGGGGRLGHLEIAEHDVIAARAELADRRRSAPVSPVSGSTILVSMLGSGRPMVPALSSIAVVGAGLRRDRRAFGLPEHDGEGRAKLFLEPLAPARRHGRAARADRLDRGEIGCRKGRMLQHRDQHGRHADHGIAAIGPEHLEHDGRARTPRPAPASPLSRPRRARSRRSRRCGTAAWW